MKIIDNINEINNLLEEYKNAKALLCQYSLSLTRIAINLSLASTERELYIIAGSCEFMTTRFRWNNVELEVSVDKDPTTKEDIFYLKDKKSDFMLKCTGGIVVIKANPNEVKFSIDHFIELN